MTIESSVKDIESLHETFEKEFSAQRDVLWKKVSELKTWAERDKSIRLLLNFTKVGFGLADGDEFNKLIATHADERKRGAERWEE